MRGLILEITKHDHIVKREMDIYLFEKYHESFEIRSLNSRFLDPDYFSTVVLSKDPKAKFTVIGTPIAESNNHYRFVDNYMQIKWQEEANHELAPILRKGISPNMYLEVEIPDQIDFDEYKNTTLSLKKFQQQYPNISIVNIRLIYGTQFKQEDDIFQN
ncbi:hypothetical protein ACE3MZ_17130 [Paenibacillus sp. WLX1005]|uniref:hypothetical protein n=1 Tax=Paenibacillus sp. WLX1005 TaxID=3243766 RepID=UPI003983F0F5